MKNRHPDYAHIAALERELGLAPELPPVAVEPHQLTEVHRPTYSFTTGPMYAFQLDLEQRKPLIYGPRGEPL